MACLLPKIKIAAISGSLRKSSFNTGLIKAVVAHCNDPARGIEIQKVDITHLPVFNIDDVHGVEFPNEVEKYSQVIRESANVKFPTAVETFRQEIKSFDAFLFASPQYNNSIAGPLKNAIDWAYLDKECWNNKAAAVVSAGGHFGMARSHHDLRQVGTFLNLHFINEPHVYLSASECEGKFDPILGALTDVETQEKLQKVIDSLREFTLKLRTKVDSA